MGKPAKLYALPGGKGRHGSLHTRRLQIECAACGNTERFYGTAYTNPMIVVQQLSPNRYDVIEISYKSGGEVDEIVERCAVCNAGREKLIFVDLDRDTGK